MVLKAVSLQLQGDGKVARKITVGIATPSVGGAAGDVVLSINHLSLVMLVGFIPHRTLGESLV